MVKKTPVVQIESIRPAIEESERFLQWVMENRGMDIPDKPITITVQTRGKRAHLCGWFSREQWSTREGTMCHELGIAAEHLQGEVIPDILHILTHEAVHFWMDHAGVKGVSAGGRHNKTFKEYAEIVGLQVDDADKVKGFAFTHMTDELHKVIETEFQPEYTKFNLFRVVKPTTPKESKMKKWSCECEPPINLRVAKEIDVTCNVCEQKFEKQE